LLLIALLVGGLAQFVILVAGSAQFDVHNCAPGAPFPDPRATRSIARQVSSRQGMTRQHAD
jgi:hypothetical protein